MRGEACAPPPAAASGVPPAAALWRARMRGVPPPASTLSRALPAAAELGVCAAAGMPAPPPAPRCADVGVAGRDRGRCCGGWKEKSPGRAAGLAGRLLGLLARKRLMYR